MRTFRSAPPDVQIVNAFARPFENAVATARTCYSSKGIVTVPEVGGDDVADPAQRALKAERRDSLAKSIYEAGHHTTLQHAHFQFALNNVSRQFCWSFLHAHPFYNSEQVSQRYVEVKPGTYAIPPLEGEALEVYERTVADQMETYHRLIGMLKPIVATAYYGRFPSRRRYPKYDRDVQKKSQEIARYVLPIATFAYLYHTVSGLTLLRYYRLCEQYDAPLETRTVVTRMVEEMLRVDPLFRTILEKPVPMEETPEYGIFTAFHGAGEASGRHAAAFRKEFDASLDGHVSKLIDRKAGNEASVARAVREVFGLPATVLSDMQAIELALNPAKNAWFGESLNVSTLSKLGRCLFHASYTFAKKLSHTADSQDQRHRMTPASRPCLAAHLGDEPDYVVPALVMEDAAVGRVYDEAMHRAWEGYSRLRGLGVPVEFASYVLPNALSIRFTESADLLNLHHKHKMRLCYNAQEEIWRASLDEAMQIRAVEPNIGKYLLPPCGLRLLSGTTPYCPEGDRYCGVPVWKFDLSRYRRTI